MARTSSANPLPARPLPSPPPPPPPPPPPHTPHSGRSPNALQCQGGTPHPPAAAHPGSGMSHMTLCFFFVLGGGGKKMQIFFKDCLGGRWGQEDSLFFVQGCFGGEVAMVPRRQTLLFKEFLVEDGAKKTDVFQDS